MKLKKKNEKVVSVYTNEAGQMLDEKPSKMGIGAKIICIITAFLLWLYVSGDQTFEKSFVELPVSIDGEESILSEGLEAISKSDAVATVTVSGKRSQINRLKESDLRLSISLKGITSSQQYILPIKVDTPSGVSLVSVYPESVNVYIDSVKASTVPVKASVVSGGVKDIVPSEIKTELDIQEVTITGPSAIVNSVTSAVAEVNLGGIISSSVDVDAQVKLYNEQGDPIESEYLTVTPKTINAHIPVYSSKSVRVVPVFEGGNPKDFRYEITPKNVVIISEDFDILSNITEISTLPITVNDDTEATYTCDLSIPSGIKLDSNISKVQVKVSAFSEASLEISNILHINLNKRFIINSAQEKLTVNFIGTPANLAKLNGGNVYAVADLSAVTTSGEHSVPVMIVAINNDEVYPDDDYSIVVTLEDFEETENK